MNWTEYLDGNNFLDFQMVLLDWFQDNMRDFPWRRTVDPFKILVAEKLLQQTIARDNLVLIYEKFLDCYPTPLKLSEATDKEVAQIIQPLGLVYRSKELRTMAQEIVNFYDGLVPDNIQELLALTGIGDYCARAVLSFGYGKQIAIVDTNVARFLYRLLGIEDKYPSNPARNNNLRAIATSLLPPNKARDFNLAILDLCSLICKPKTPLCLDCPVQKYCAYRMSQRE